MAWSGSASTPRGRNGSGRWKNSVGHAKRGEHANEPVPPQDVQGPVDGRAVSAGPDPARQVGSGAGGPLGPAADGDGPGAAAGSGPGPRGAVRGDQERQAAPPGGAGPGRDLIPGPPPPRTAERHHIYIYLNPERGL